jgi:hypothetical protein
MDETSVSNSDGRSTMACTVLFRYQMGLPYRQASPQERDAWARAFADMLRKWKSSGVKLKASFNSSSRVGGFCHNWIMEAGSMEFAQGLSSDLVTGPVGKLLEDFSIEVGGSMAEKFWEEA